MSRRSNSKRKRFEEEEAAVGQMKKMHISDELMYVKFISLLLSLAFYLYFFVKKFPIKLIFPEMKI